MENWSSLHRIDFTAAANPSIAAALSYFVKKNKIAGSVASAVSVDQLLPFVGHVLSELHEIIWPIGQAYFHRSPSLAALEMSSPGSGTGCSLSNLLRPIGELQT